MADAVGGKKNVIDKISNLPDDVLLHIISFLPIDDTIPIPFLSTRFRKLSSSIPILVCKGDGYTGYQFAKFMEKTLSKYEKLQRVQKFRLEYLKYKKRSITISWWINSVVTARASNLQELDIHVNYQGERVYLPCSVFSICQKLNFLKLVGNIKVGEIPKGLHLPCLKTLELDRISIDSENPLISTVFLSVLETFLIKDCYLESLRENLKLGYIKGYLESPNGTMSNWVLKQLALQNTDMFGIVNVMGREGINPPFFPHLTHVTVSFYPMYPFPSVLPLLLQHTPKLTFLDLKIIRSYIKIRQWDAPASIDYHCLLHNLETVKISDPYHEFPWEEVVKYFLKNAKVLKKLVLCAKRPLSDKIKASIVDQRRASAQSEVELVSV